MELEELVLQEVQKEINDKEVNQFNYLSLDIGDIIEVLSEHNDNLPVFVYRVDKGLLEGVKGEYDTYRGDYSQGALEHCDAEDASFVHQVNKALKSALINTQEGYRGGEYKHTLSTDVYLANYGEWSNVAIHKAITIKIDCKEYPVFIASEVDEE